LRRSGHTWRAGWRGPPIWVTVLPLHLGSCSLSEDDVQGSTSHTATTGDSTPITSENGATSFDATVSAGTTAAVTSEVGDVSGVETTNADLTDGTGGESSFESTGDTSVAPPPPPHFVLECGPPEPSDIDDVAAWQAEAIANPPSTRGHSARLALLGLPLHIAEGPIHATIPGGLCEFEFDASDGVYLFAEATAVTVTAEGEAPRDLGPGLVVLRASGGDDGSGLRLDYAELAEIPGSSARLDPSPVPVIREVNHELRGSLPSTAERMSPTAGLPQDLAGAQESALRFASGPVVLETAYPVLPYFVGPDGAAELLGPETVHLSLQGEDGAFLSTARGYTLLPDHLSLRLEGEGRFALSSDFSGLLEIEAIGYPRPEDLKPPVAIFGTHATLTIAETGDVEGTARVTQALDDAGLLRPARVQMVATSRRIELEPEEKVLHTIHVREGSFTGDGLAATVTLTGDLPEGMLELRADTLPSWIRIFGIVDDAGWVGAPTLAVIATLGSVSILVAETFECVFTFGFGCDFGLEQGFDSYATVSQAGEVDDFEIALNGVGEVGDVYNGVLRFEGQNYCPVEIEIEVELVCRPDGDELCDDGADNDCNAAADCEDPACLGLGCDPSDVEAVCSPSGLCE